jgi:hypothetical protein
MVHANDNKTRRRIVQTVLTICIFIASWAALHLFGQLVDLAEIREWLEKHDWWVFINRNIREAILTQFWQILLALIAALKAFSRIDPLATAIAKRYLPEFPWFLSNPKRSHRSDFAEYGELALVGRSEELAALERFLDRDVKFSWRWLNGRGGSGKSRLTREWMRMLPKPLRCRIFATDCASEGRADRAVETTPPQRHRRR